MSEVQTIAKGTNNTTFLEKILDEIPADKLDSIELTSLSDLILTIVTDDKYFRKNRASLLLYTENNQMEYIRCIGAANGHENQDNLNHWQGIQGLPIGPKIVLKQRETTNTINNALQGLTIQLSDYSTINDALNMGQATSGNKDGNFQSFLSCELDKNGVHPDKRNEYRAVPINLDGRAIAVVVIENPYTYESLDEQIVPLQGFLSEMAPHLAKAWETEYLRRELHEFKHKYQNETHDERVNIIREVDKRLNDDFEVLIRELLDAAQFMETQLEQENYESIIEKARSVARPGLEAWRIFENYINEFKSKQIPIDYKGATDLPRRGQLSYQDRLAAFRNFFWEDMRDEVLHELDANMSEIWKVPDGLPKNSNQANNYRRISKWVTRFKESVDEVATYLSRFDRYNKPIKYQKIDIYELIKHKKEQATLNRTNGYVLDDYNGACEIIGDQERLGTNIERILNYLSNKTNSNNDIKISISKEEENTVVTFRTDNYHARKGAVTHTTEASEFTMAKHDIRRMYGVLPPKIEENSTLTVKLLISPNPIGYSFQEVSR